MASPVTPVTSVTASLPPVNVDRTRDAGKQGDYFEAASGEPRATDHGRRARLWRPYSKGGVKKKYRPAEKKKSARELFEAVLLSANGAQVLNDAWLNQTRSKERKSRDDSVDGIDLSGMPRLIQSHSNAARKADAHLLRILKKQGFATRHGQGRSAAGTARNAARYREKLAQAIESFKALSITALDKATTAPLDQVSQLTGVQGLREEDIRRLSSEALQALVAPSIDMVKAISAQRPDPQKTKAAFGDLVDFCARQNDQGVRPGISMGKGVQRVPGATLVSSAIALITNLSGHARRVLLPF